MTIAVPLLAAPTPDAWLEGHLVANQSAHEEPGEPAGAERRRIAIPDLLADDASFLRRAHATLIAQDGATPAAAAKWLVGWFAGGVAGTAGFVYAAASAALLIAPEAVRFRLHPDGWPDRCDPGPVRVAVTADHPWAGQDGVRVAADDAELAALAVEAVRAAAEPIVEAGRTLAKVGRPALWAEVADGFGLPVLHQPDLPVETHVVARLQHGVRSAGRPWRQVPELHIGHLPDGPAYLGRKAGCCLAYQCPEEPEPDPAELDERERAYRARFPPQPGAPRYCSTCSLRDLAGCTERQLFWMQQERAARAARAQR